MTPIATHNKVSPRPTSVASYSLGRPLATYSARHRGNFVAEASAPPTQCIYADASLPQSGRGILRNFNKKGFALLFTILVVSILLAISLSISNITLRELILSSATRDSHMAFYAADTAFECGLYLDKRKNALSIDQTTGNIVLDQSAVPSCAIEDTTVVHTNNKKMYFKSPDDAKYCFTFSVDKTDSIQGRPQTIIEARGYNTCLNSVRRVERGLRISYIGQ